MSYLSVVDFVCYETGGDIGYYLFRKHFFQIMHNIKRRSNNPKHAIEIYIHTLVVSIVKNADEVEVVVVLVVVKYNKHTELLSHNKQLLMASAQLRQDDPD